MRFQKEGITPIVTSNYHPPYSGRLYDICKHCPASNPQHLRGMEIKIKTKIEIEKKPELRA